ncbi:MAG: alpha/beta hydrolase [Thermosynechococcaceae cyanobacterium]
MSRSRPTVAGLSNADESSSPFPLTYRQLGQGVPILCLHGHPGSADCMSVFTESLAQRFRTIAPDLRGYGRSQTRSPFTMADHLLDLTALLDHLNLQNCIILGWSLGGILALELALHHPDRIRGLILVATAAKPVSNLPRPSVLDLLNTLIAGSLNRLKPGWAWNIRTFGQRSLLKDLLSQHTPEAYRFLDQAGTSATLRTSRQAQQALNQALQQRYNRLDALANIHCPSLILSGAQDRHILPTASYETAQYLKNSHYICYPDVAHLFPWEIPTQVNHDIGQWLDSLLL